MRLFNSWIVVLNTQWTVKTILNYSSCCLSFIFQLLVEKLKLNIKHERRLSLEKKNMTNLLSFSFWECAPSSDDPTGSNITLRPVASWKVSVTGMLPPSRVRSGSTPKTITQHCGWDKNEWIKNTFLFKQHIFGNILNCKGYFTLLCKIIKSSETISDLFDKFNNLQLNHPSVVLPVFIALRPAM